MTFDEMRGKAQLRLEKKRYIRTQLNKLDISYDPLNEDPEWVKIRIDDLHELLRMIEELTP